ncbi:unnamed protein product, partial [Gongylonema pulchrum]|uniref:Reverse transcriptase domain-containing protein n=1 Tax=Gongylonema pulchrum TaxID=637853 RepID=A0A183DIU1_9BILA
MARSVICYPCAFTTLTPTLYISPPGPSVMLATQDHLVTVQSILPRKSAVSCVRFTRIPSNPPVLLCRYVDDLLMLNCPDSYPPLQHIYGQHFGTEITGSDISVDYSDMTFTI